MGKAKNKFLDLLKRYTDNRAAHTDSASGSSRFSYGEERSAPLYRLEAELTHALETFRRARAP